MKQIQRLRWILLVCAERLEAYSAEKLIKRICLIKSQPADLLASSIRFSSSVSAVQVISVNKRFTYQL